MKKNDLKNQLWQAQNSALRDPVEVLCQNYLSNDLTRQSLLCRADTAFVKLLAKLQITLMISREYEHLVLALTPANGKIKQSFIRLPHPSGIAVDRDKQTVYVAATRNPNQVWEFKPVARLLPRSDCRRPGRLPRYLMPARIKFCPGAFYLHDLAVINGRLYGASAGQNSIVEINLNESRTDKIVWQPKNVTDKKANFIQLNSIAAGPTLAASFFSASGDHISSRRPGHLNYPIDKTGVIFDGASRQPWAGGLTRPHSARLHRGQLWVDNSGYGEFGYIENKKFQPIIKLPGWTRGLCLIGDFAIVGVSRVLPRYKHYAPGLKNLPQICGLYAVNLNTAKISGSVIWPFGNQIFSIDWLPKKTTPGFVFNKASPTSDQDKNIFYAFQL